MDKATYQSEKFTFQEVITHSEYPVQTVATRSEMRGISINLIVSFQIYKACMVPWLYRIDFLTMTYTQSL